uniref:Reticulon-like protein n=1 Tax=Hadrurus spadix TaxID=141984 RepID=A0A1W7R9U1_9SCOR
MDAQEVTTTSIEPTEEPLKVVDGCSCPFSARTWFQPELMHPTVRDLVYWRDIRKSGLLFGSGLVLLLSLTYCSVISVIAYSALAVLSFTTGFRIYKNVLQAVQKSGNGHPFKEYLDMDIQLPSNRVHENVDVALQHFNTTAQRLRSLFLVEDLVDSLKLGVMLWCLTYVGAWFNGMTLLLLAYVGVFSLPKVYETNKAQIDRYLDLVCAQIKNVTAKVRAKIPQGKKKEQ